MRWGVSREEPRSVVERGWVHNKQRPAAGCAGCEEIAIHTVGS